RPDLPELGEELVLDQAAQELDRRSLRTARDLADRSRHDLVVAEAPDRHPLVPFGQELRKLVDLLVLAPARVDLDERKAPLAAEVGECLPERRRDAPHLAESRRVEARAVAEHLPDLVVLPR